MAITSINPATGKVLMRFSPLNDSEIEAKLALASRTFPLYKATPLSARREWLLSAAQILESERDRIGRLMSLEMGKPIQAARDEASKCAVACRYYAENGERILADRPVPTGKHRSYIKYQPLGPILAVMPWNFPLWQVFRFAAPALMAGNVGLLKHSSNVPQCALEIEALLKRSGFPEGAFQTLLIGSEQVERLLTDQRIRAATLTGSEGAGSRVAAIAGRELKKTVMELGGSDPFVVLPSADLELAAKTAVKSRMINNGQSCIAAKRFIVHEQIYEAFEERFTRRVRELKVGDPLDESTDIGPLATPEIVDGVHKQVEKTLAEGAILKTGGTKVPAPGNFYNPTVLGRVPEGATAAREEVFGPVAALFAVKDLDHAIRLANSSEFGLGASVWTSQLAEQTRLIAEIEAGSIFVNSMVASDPALPFGGIKRSGYGRELSSEGMLEFVNIKTVSLDGPLKASATE